MHFAHFLGNRIIRIEETDKPQLGADEVLLKVDSCAICGSEKSIFLKGKEGITGHEVSGIVAEKGGSAKA